MVDGALDSRRRWNDTESFWEGWVGSVAQGAAAADVGDAGGVFFGREVDAALDQFERIFLIGQPQRLGAAQAHHDDVVGRVERLFPRRFPLEMMADAARAPGARIVVERRAVVGEGFGRGAGGRPGVGKRCRAGEGCWSAHGAKMTRRARSVQPRILIRDIARRDGTPGAGARSQSGNAGGTSRGRLTLAA